MRTGLTYLMLLPLAMLATFLAGVALIVISRRSRTGYPACGGCGYDLSGTVGEKDRCPECGAPFSDVGIMPPNAGRRPVMLGLGIGLLAISLMCTCGGLATSFLGFSSVQRTNVPMPAPPPPAFPPADETLDPPPAPPAEPVREPSEPSGGGG